MACEPNTLLDSARCFQCLSQKELQQVVTYLLCQILSNGSSGSAGLSGAGSPEGVVTANPGTTYVNTTDESFWVKKTGTGNTGWIKLIA